ncbi:hypothetical protein KA525_03815 [Candidatus Woesebacteria bacterium]|nr:hypothetical protein [Candidatus Woesebacteria bacterium]
MNKNLQLYEKYFVQNQSVRPGLFRAIKERYSCTSAVYPGSFIHVTPSLIFQNTAYIDSDRRVQKFFDDPEILKWVESNKEYEAEPIILGFQQNYTKKLPEDIGEFDLLISQYAGFVSQDCKKYLKKNGILLVNNSHADAGLAFLDIDYELIAVVNHSNNQWTIKETGLDEYFIPKKGSHPPKASLLKTMRGIGYTKTASNYVFRKI